jgi:hypothetical protein
MPAMWAASVAPNARRSVGAAGALMDIVVILMFAGTPPVHARRHALAVALKSGKLAFAHSLSR